MNHQAQRLIVLLSVLLLVAGACGNDSRSGTEGAGSSISGSASRQERTAPDFGLAATKTLDAQTMRFSMTMSIAPVGQIEGVGFTDLAKGTASMTMTMPPLEPGMPAFTMDQLFLGQTLYMHLPMFDEGLPPGKRWVKLDLAALGNELGIDFGAILEQSKQSDVRSQLTFLQGVRGEVQELGEAQIRGTKTTHYKFTVDIDQALSEMAPEYAELAPFVRELGITEFPAEAWVDDEGLVRRITYTINVPADPETTQMIGPMTMSMDFFDFGAAEVLSAPPASEVIDFRQALQILE